MRVNGQLAFAGYRGDRIGEFKLGSLAVLTLRGNQISEFTAFLDPAVNSRFPADSLPTLIET